MISLLRLKASFPDANIIAESGDFEPRIVEIVTSLFNNTTADWHKRIASGGVTQVRLRFRSGSCHTFNVHVVVKHKYVEDWMIAGDFRGPDLECREFLRLGLDVSPFCVTFGVQY